MSLSLHSSKSTLLTNFQMCSDEDFVNSGKFCSGADIFQICSNEPDLVPAWGLHKSLVCYIHHSEDSPSKVTGNFFFWINDNRSP